MAEYGYEDTGLPSPHEKHQLVGNNVAMGTGQAYPHVVWKNKHMTYQQANNFAARFHQSAVAGGMKMGAWLSPSAVVTNKHIKELFDQPVGRIGTWYDGVRNEFLPKYLEKKLGQSF